LVAGASGEADIPAGMYRFAIKGDAGDWEVALGKSGKAKRGVSIKVKRQ
jgi:hypothetical protein